MIITKKDLTTIEETVKHNCTAGVRADKHGLALRVWAKHPETENILSYEQIFLFKNMLLLNFNRDMLIDRFAHQVKHMFDSRLP